MVSKGFDKKLGIPVAIKTIYRSMLDSDEGFLEEYEMLKQLEHPNIMRTYDLIYDHKKFNLITELYQGGDLFDKIESAGYIEEGVASNYMK